MKHKIWNFLKKLHIEDFYGKKSVLFRIGILILCMIGLSFSWFNLKNYEGGNIEYEKQLRIASSGGKVTNYIGTITGENGTNVSYTELKDGIKVVWQEYGNAIQEVIEGKGSFVADNLYPGARLYFKTVIENTQDTPIALSLYLTGIEYSAALNPAIRFVETQPSSYNHCYEDDAHETVKNGERVCTLSAARVTDLIEIPSRTYDSGSDTWVNGTATIYWYIEISGEEAGNECANGWITLSQMQLLTGSDE